MNKDNLTLNSQIPQTKVNRNHSNSESLKTTIPSIIKTIMGLEVKDELIWTIIHDDDKNKWVAYIDKKTTENTKGKTHTKVNKNNSKTKSIKTTIPAVVKTILCLEINDKIEWTVLYDKENNKWIACIEKADNI